MRKVVQGFSPLADDSRAEALDYFSRSFRSTPTMSFHPRTATRSVTVPYQTTQAQMRKCQKVHMGWFGQGGAV